MYLNLKLFSYWKTEEIILEILQKLPILFESVDVLKDP
jgi:hypothetical protein